MEQIRIQLNPHLDNKLDEVVSNRSFQSKESFVENSIRDFFNVQENPQGTEAFSQLSQTTEYSSVSNSDKDQSAVVVTLHDSVVDKIKTEQERQDIGKQQLLIRIIHRYIQLEPDLNVKVDIHEDEETKGLDEILR